MNEIEANIKQMTAIAKHLRELGLAEQFESVQRAVDNLRADLSRLTGVSQIALSVAKRMETCLTWDGSMDDFLREAFNVETNS
jgi:hypothetical protein